MAAPSGRAAVPVDVAEPLWERCFLVAPLVIVGTREPDGSVDMAPKHMAGPVSWQNLFGFVCAPTHATYRNAVREGVFTVSYPRPEQVLLTSLAAAPRCEDGDKHALTALPTEPARAVDGELLRDAYVQLECELDRVVEDLGDNVLLVGRVVAAAVAEDALRVSDQDDGDLLDGAPLLAYLHPGRYARVAESFSFPFHAGFSR
jgi:flavin reductase (DIM6/NTAB) family NADH-FMN oxidoreductase RutF